MQWAPIMRSRSDVRVLPCSPPLGNHFSKLALNPHRITQCDCSNGFSVTSSEDSQSPQPAFAEVAEVADLLATETRVNLASRGIVVLKVAAGPVQQKFESLR